MTRPAVDWHARHITSSEQMVIAALACTEVAADLTAAQLTAIGGHDLLAALERLSVAHHAGTRGEVEAAARDVAIAVPAVHVPADDAEVISFHGAALHLRGRLRQADEATAAIQHAPAARPGPLQMQVGAGAVVQAGQIGGEVRVVFQVHERPPTPHQLPEPKPVTYPHVQTAVEEMTHVLNERPADHFLVVVSGPPGAGATTAALAFLKPLIRPNRADLCIDLGHGACGTPPHPEDLLYDLLVAVGTPADRIPPGGNRAAWWRGAADGPLLLIDGAISAAQVRPLLPGRGGVVVVTSRRAISGLVLDGARLICLDLDKEEDTSS
jgi:hypothetical protein